jgi:hypothetical protein
MISSSCARTVVWTDRSDGNSGIAYQLPGCFLSTRDVVILVLAASSDWVRRKFATEWSLPSPSVR